MILPNARHSFALFHLVSYLVKSKTRYVYVYPGTSPEAIETETCLSLGDIVNELNFSVARNFVVQN